MELTIWKSDRICVLLLLSAFRKCINDGTKSVNQLIDQSVKNNSINKFTGVQKKKNLYRGNKAEILQAPVRFYQMDGLIQLDVNIDSMVVCVSIFSCSFSVRM